MSVVREAFWDKEFDADSGVDVTAGCSCPERGWQWRFYNTVLCWCTTKGFEWFPTTSLLKTKPYHTVLYIIRWLSHCSSTNLHKFCIQVTKGLYTFLLQLFVLRCFQSPDGIIWRCNDSHIYLVEYTKRKHRECDRHSSEVITMLNYFVNLMW